jgi:hypothetical protein
MAMKKVIFAAMLLGTTTFANAENTNFSYTTLGTPLCSTNVCFSSFGNAGVNGSYQFNDNTAAKPNDSSIVSLFQTSAQQK